MSKSTPKIEANHDAVKRRVQPLVSLWMERGKQLHKTQDEISALLMAAPEAPLFKAAWDCFSGYTRNLAKNIGDQDGFLEWFAWECEFGKKPMEVKFPNGEKLMVCGVADLVDAIITDEKGNRIFKANAQPTGREDNERSVGRVVELPEICIHGVGYGDPKTCVHCHEQAERNAESSGPTKDVQPDV